MSTPPSAGSLACTKRLFGYLKQYWRLFALSLLALAVATATEPAFARLMETAGGWRLCRARPERA